MGALLIEARDAHRDSPAEGKKTLDPDIVTGLTSRYRPTAESGLTAPSTGGPAPRATPAPAAS
jgi:hypothetical protein